jgi:hypothetical protein
MRFFRRLLLLVCIVSLIPGLDAAASYHAPAAAEEQSLLLELGYLDVTGAPYHADPKGTQDSTSAIQQAIEDAYDQQLVTFFPEGEYLVSDTLVMRQDAEHWNRKETANLLVGSTSGERPVIRLKDNATGFGGDSQKPLLYIHATSFPSLPVPDYVKDPENQKDINFNQGIIGVNLEVGNGNEGAVGINFPGAQDCVLEDIKITLRSGYAGITGLPGVSSVLGNIEIVGGRYGLATQKADHPTFNNLILRDQTEYAIYDYKTAGVMNLAGFRIIKDHAPAVQMTSAWSLGGGNITFLDGSFEFAENNGQPAIDNAIGRSIVLKNVFFKNAGTIIQSGSNPAWVGAPGWLRVEEYAAPLEKPGPVDGENVGRTLIDGIEDIHEVRTPIQFESTPPPDLSSRHTWGKSSPTADVILKMIEDGATQIVNAKNVPGYPVYGDGDRSFKGGHDDTANLQWIIDHYDMVLLPKGRYLINDTLVLRENTHLIGIANHLSIIGPHPDWKPTSPVNLLQTEDSASARTRLEHLNLIWNSGPVEHDWFTGLDWRAGRNSVVNNIYLKARWSAQARQHATTDWLITGNGGGKWFGTGMGNNNGEDPYLTHPQKRTLVVEETTEPLTIYSLNLEDGRAGLVDPINGWQGDIRNAQNVAIIGFKSENENDLRVIDSDNVAIFGTGGHSPVVRFVNTTRAFLANSTPITWKHFGTDQPETDPQFVEVFQNDPENPESRIGMDRILALFKRGEMDFDVFRMGDLPEQIFSDVPPNHPYFAAIELLNNQGFTAGCSTDPPRFCPDDVMNRAESAVFVERGIHGTDLVPPQPDAQIFDDLPLTSWAAKWAQALYEDDFTAGCGEDSLIYCPERGHTRAEGAVFYLRMLHGAAYSPPDPSGLFSDVSSAAWEARWVEKAYLEGVLPACGENPLRICPSDALTRGLAAYMMVQAKGLK